MGKGYKSCSKIFSEIHLSLDYKDYVYKLQVLQQYVLRCDSLPEKSNITEIQLSLDYKNSVYKLSVLQQYVFRCDSMPEQSYITEIQMRLDYKDYGYNLNSTAPRLQALCVQVISPAKICFEVKPVVCIVVVVACCAVVIILLTTLLVVLLPENNDEKATYAKTPRTRPLPTTTVTLGPTEPSKEPTVKMSESPSLTSMKTTRVPHIDTTEVEDVYTTRVTTTKTLGPTESSMEQTAMMSEYPLLTTMQITTTEEANIYTTKYTSSLCVTMLDDGECVATIGECESPKSIYLLSGWNTLCSGVTNKPYCCYTTGATVPTFAPTGMESTIEGITEVSEKPTVRMTEETKLTTAGVTGIPYTASITATGEQNTRFTTTNGLTSAHIITTSEYAMEVSPEPDATTAEISVTTTEMSTTEEVYLSSKVTDEFATTEGMTTLDEGYWSTGVTDMYMTTEGYGGYATTEEDEFGTLFPNHKTTEEKEYGANTEYMTTEGFGATEYMLTAEFGASTEFITTAEIPEPTTEFGYTTLGKDYEYYIVDSENNWLYHKLNCVNAPDGSLAIINTDAQQNEVVDLILQYTDGLENVALNKSANQSSDIDPLETEDMASKGVDGDIDQCTETYSGELVDDHWWRVDLGRNYAVLNVTVYNNVSAGGGKYL
uniref:Cell agglutination protein 1742.01-like n=1 Tax=Saccoglossus kowalevskii TaxID=10224 RepID=A0ABM0MVI8_SACKO|nr:PREDICTED: putative cell agglutination protein 1742.01-like [Saccoglossus kowalevskii]